MSDTRATMRVVSKDWFERLTGFREEGYEETQRRLRVEGEELVSLVNGKRYGIGHLLLTSLGKLRGHADLGQDAPTTVQCVTGDVRAMHSEPEYDGALFQVASQFNLLEMTGPSVTPEDGVTRYGGDPTQGPACAIAAGAATIYRNYFVPVGDFGPGGDQIGQTRDRQLDALDLMGAALSRHLDRPVSDLWTMRNGYALCSESGLDAIARLIDEGGEELRDELRQSLRIGYHQGVEVTDVRGGERRFVAQAFCSALPVAYGGGRREAWEAFARIVLEAAYEATLLAAVDRVPNIVLLTRVGGGAFGNADEWIDDAIVRAIKLVERAGLDIRLVSRGSVHPSFRAIAEQFNG